MLHSVRIHLGDEDSTDLSLDSEVNVFGTSDTCNLQFEHNELSEESLNIEVNSGEIWINNRNSYSIYVGDEEVPGGSWAQWNTGVQISLTRSISLELIGSETQETLNSSAAKPVQSSSMNFGTIAQMVVIGLCFAGAIAIFAGGKRPSGAEELQETSFQLEASIDELIPHEERRPEIRSLRRLLQKAWLSDRRWSSTNSPIVVKNYQDLLNHQYFRTQSAVPVDIDSIKIFAKSRISALLRSGAE